MCEVVNAVINTAVCFVFQISSYGVDGCQFMSSHINGPRPREIVVFALSNVVWS
jgi:hypothetical protein